MGMMRWILAVSFVSLLSVPCLAQTPEAIGAITSLEGLADISRAGVEKEYLKEGAPIYLNDRIRTKSYSKVAITFLDKSVVKLAPSTCIAVDQYKVSSGNKRDIAVIKLTRGTVEAIVSKTGLPDTFHIMTPNAIGSVKGSDIFVSFQADKTGVMVREGLMSVANLALPGTRIEVAGGDATLIPAKEVPAQTRRYMDVEMKLYDRNVEAALSKKMVSLKGNVKMIAAISSVAGEVRLYKKVAVDWRDAKMGQAIGEGDKLQTGADGRAEIRLDNGNSISIQPGSELALVKLQYDPATGEFDNTFESGKGKIKAVIEKLGKGSTFQVKTPTAVCGARGTVMYLDVQPSVTQAAYEGGGGIITSPISGQTQLVEPGQMTTIDLAGAIAAPVFASAEQRLATEQTFSEQAVIGQMAAPAHTSSDTHALADALAPAASQTTQSMAAAPSTTFDISHTFVDAPTFNEVTSIVSTPTLVTTIIYSVRLNWDALTDPSFNTSTLHMDVELKSDGKWKGSISSTLDSPLGSGISIHFKSAVNDTLQLMGPSVGGVWSTPVGDCDGSMVGVIPNKTIVGVAQGTYDATTFQGTAEGTWTNT